MMEVSGEVLWEFMIVGRGSGSLEEGSMIHNDLEEIPLEKPFALLNGPS